MNKLDVSLYRADIVGGKLVYGWTDAENPTNGDAGILNVLVDDVLTLINVSRVGTNVSMPMYFTIVPAVSQVGQDVPHQATFKLIQTGPIPPPSAIHSIPTQSLAASSLTAQTTSQSGHPTATGSGFSTSASDGDVSKDPSRRRVSASVIAGVVVGGLAALALVALGTWIMTRYYRPVCSQDVKLANLKFGLGSEVDSIVDGHEDRTPASGGAPLGE